MSISFRMDPGFGVSRAFDLQRARMTIFFFFLLTAPAGAEIFRGQVVDARTGQPIRGAVVVAIWPNRDIEVETDAEGRFIFDRPSGISAGQEIVAVYKFEYIVWLNRYFFDPTDHRKGYFRPRSDFIIPPLIPLELFPKKGDRAIQLWLLTWILEGDGRKERRPKLAHAIQQEIEEVLKQCQPNCSGEYK
jgi:hypothetical protein